MVRMDAIWGADYLQFKPVRQMKENGHFVGQSPFKFAVFQGAVRICLGKEMSLHLQCELEAVSCCNGHSLLLPYSHYGRPLRLDYFSPMGVLFVLGFCGRLRPAFTCPLFTRRILSIPGVHALFMKSSPLLWSRKLLEDGKILHSSAPMMDVPEMVNAKFNSSLAIIIVALFFSILCGLGINALLRCRLLCRRWLMVSEPSHDVGVERAKTGINKFDLKALPVSVHSTGSPLGGLDCPICLAEFMEGERVRVLPECSHSFHADCIDAWLHSNPACPSCRHPLLCILSKKPSGVSRPEESARVDVTERNESVAADHVVQSFHISGDDSTVIASSSLGSIKSSDLESGNAVETRRP